MFISLIYCVGRGPCDDLITRSEASCLACVKLSVIWKLDTEAALVEFGC
jgi:hypothetical protein